MSTYFTIILIIYILILIYLSHQSYEKTSKLSWKIVLFIAEFINRTHIGKVESFDDAHLINKYLRKSAHFFLFLTLAIFFYLYYIKINKNFLLLAFPFIFAFIDEKTKILIKNRHYEFDEFMLNILGIIVGYSICFLFSVII